MSVLTETELRARYNKEKFNKLVIDLKDKLTPSAREFLDSRGIEVIFGEENIENILAENKNSETVEEIINQDKKFLLEGTNAWLDEKPEFMTILEENILVFKDDERIVFRSKIESFLAELLYVINQIKDYTNEDVLKGLKEIFLYTKSLARAERVDEYLEELSILSYRGSTIKEVLENNSKPYSYDGFDLSYESSMETLMLNKLRAAVRELEIAGIKTYRIQNKIERRDILVGLNQLSHAVELLISKTIWIWLCILVS